MKALIGIALGVGLGLAAAVAVVPLASCSCPPGYEAKRKPPGTYSVTRADVDGGSVAFGQLVVTNDAVVHTVTTTAGTYEMTYVITGTEK